MNRKDGSGTWHHTPGTSSGTIQLGPFRDGQETMQEIRLDFMIHHNWVGSFDFRIAFTLDPDGGLNDPSRGNNQTYSGAFIWHD